MICAIGISQKDHHLALKWLSWVEYLSRKETDLPDRVRLIALGTRNINQYGWQMLRESARRMQVEWAICMEENETGYPKSASHLFLSTMEYCERHHPGHPVLWVESDAIPTRAGWREQIAHEYANCGKPFMGVIESGHGPAHMAGVAVYPPDWRAKAPLLADVMNAPDVFWGPGLGQAFDTYASSQIVPQAAAAKTIQQIWRPPHPITQIWASRFIQPDTALFHQCKDGSLIEALGMACGRK